VLSAAYCFFTSGIVFGLKRGLGGGEGKVDLGDGRGVGVREEAGMTVVG